MSISTISAQSPIWNNAASALTNTPQPNSATKAKPNQADNPTRSSAGSISVAGSNLLDTLSQTSQSALIQMQAQLGRQTG
ncbi:MAG: hypothetical protein P4L66_06695 [Acetobacteraceae bacterium]|nr:hypothetical protein [Acetobacteraceae bacterium]